MNLPRENKIPSEPRFNYVTEKAYAFLLEQGYNRFPISPFKVLEDLSEYIVCLPWSEAKDILHSDDPFHLNHLKAEARTIRHRENGIYYIVYDDVNVNLEARITWTIMHEIGHVILGHLTDFGETALDRGGLTDEKYGVLEKEAHYFAAEFLMPTALLKFFPDITVEEIALLFGVSEDAATRKYKRVFKTSYLPDSKYDKRLVRNFYDFLTSGAEETIYKNIYGPWGLANKAKYVSVCRKCPSCYTYIGDASAIFCHYCGATINQKQTFKNMFERLQAQQAFTKLPGYSRPSIPYIDWDDKDGARIHRVRYCPNCLNSSFSDGARFCRVCGQPLYSFCQQCNTPLELWDCFCPHCGTESSFISSYKIAESRLKKVNDCSGYDFYSDNWIRYPYWGYARMRFMGERSFFNEDLKSALLYSSAFLDDNDRIFIITDSIHAAASIRDHQPIILDLLRKLDNFQYADLEVCLANDLQ